MWHVWMQLLVDKLARPTDAVRCLCPFVNVKISYNILLHHSCITFYCVAYSVGLPYLASHTIIISTHEPNQTTPSRKHLVVTAQCTTKVLLLVSRTSAKHQDTRMNPKRSKKSLIHALAQQKLGQEICKHGQYPYRKPLAESRSSNLKSTEFRLGNVKPWSACSPLVWRPPPLRQYASMDQNLRTWNDTTTTKPVRSAKAPPPFRIWQNSQLPGVLLTHRGVELYICA